MIAELKKKKKKSRKGLNIQRQQETRSSCDDGDVFLLGDAGWGWRDAVCDDDDTAADADENAATETTMVVPLAECDDWHGGARGGQRSRRKTDCDCAASCRACPLRQRVTRGGGKKGKERIHRCEDTGE